MALQFIKSRFVLLILAFGFLIRVLFLDAVPPSLNWDEVSHGYNAYSILRTGKDEWGASFPTIFRAYGDYKLPVYIYLTAVSEFFFGLNAVAVRLPSVVAGTLSIIFTYLLVRKLFRKESVALVSALLMAVEPWSLFLSRVALEANVALSFIISGVYFLLTGIEKKNRDLLLGLLLLGLSVWTYNSARIFVPLMLIVASLVYKTEFFRIIKKRKALATGCFLLSTAFFVPMFSQLASQVGQARYENLQIVNEAAVGEIVELRVNYNFPGLTERLLFNRATYFVSHFALNYLKHFSPEFLYLTGGDNYQFNIPNIGLLYLVGSPFFVAGLVEVFRVHRREKCGKLIVAWLALAPVASSITVGSPHTLRAIVMLPIPIIFTALGLGFVISRLKRGKIVAGAFVVVVAISFADYFNNYLADYRTNYSWVWQYGYKEVVDYIKPNYGDYEKIVITKKYGEPHEFILFYWPWEPARYQDEDKTRYFQSNWYWVDRFDKFYFVNDWDIPRIGSEFVLESGETFDCASCLLVTSPGNSPENWRKVKTINFLDGKAAFEIYEH